MGEWGGSNAGRSVGGRKSGVDGWEEERCRARQPLTGAKAAGRRMGGGRAPPTAPSAAAGECPGRCCLRTRSNGGSSHIQQVQLRDVLPRSNGERQNTRHRSRTVNSWKGH